MLRAGFFIIAGLCPDGKGRCEFSLPQSHVRHYQIYGPAHKFFDSLAIGYVVANPSVIFQGLERENTGQGLCYAGLPQVRFIEVDVTVAPPRGMTFAVFMRADLRIFEWGWEKADWNGYPVEAETRFGKRIWCL
jgi:hypothetical protein